MLATAIDGNGILDWNGRPRYVFIILLCNL